MRVIIPFLCATFFARASADPFRASPSVLVALRGGYGTRGTWTASSRLQKSPQNEKNGSAQRKQQQLFPTVEDSSENEIKTETKEVIDAFLTRDSRKTFIARVYAILSGQLFVTAASVILFGLKQDLSLWMLTSNTGQIVLFASFILSIVPLLVMSFSERARRESPLKWQLLTLFTLAESITVGAISGTYKFRTVLSALLSTAAAALSISTYTIAQKNPKYDLSQWGAGLSSCGMIFITFGLLSGFGVLPRNETLFGFLGACLFSFYLAHDTRLIIGGKHSKYQMNEKDYVFGAISLYLDIINIFLQILRFISEDNN